MKNLGKVEVEVSTCQVKSESVKTDNKKLWREKQSRHEIISVVPESKPGYLH